jgi:hypothetical protein
VHFPREQQPCAVVGHSLRRKLLLAPLPPRPSSRNPNPPRPSKNLQATWRQRDVRESSRCRVLTFRNLSSHRPAVRCCCFPSYLRACLVCLLVCLACLSPLGMAPGTPVSRHRRLNCPHFLCICSSFQHFLSTVVCHPAGTPVRPPAGTTAPLPESARTIVYRLAPLCMPRRTPVCYLDKPR